MFSHISPLVQEFCRQMQLMCQLHRLIRSSKAKPLQESKSALNILLCHEVSIEIVVDVLMPLIGTNHVRDFVLVLFCMPFCTAGPELSGAQKIVLLECTSCGKVAIANGVDTFLTAHLFGLKVLFADLP